MEREPGRAIGPAALFHPKQVLAPFRMLRANPAMLSITTLAFSFAIVQGCLFSFSVTYLVTARHLPLTDGGAGLCLHAVRRRLRPHLPGLAGRPHRPAGP